MTAIDRIPELKLFVDPRDSTLTRSTHVVALFVATLRLGTLLQMVPSSFVAVGASSRPGLCVVSWILAIAAAAATAGICIVRRRAPGVTWASLDVAIAVTVLLIGIATVPSELRSGSWVGFQPGYALSVACSLVAVRRPVVWMTGICLLALAQTVYLQPLFRSHSVDVATAVGDLLTLLVLSFLTWAGAGAVQGLARTADENKALAVAAGRAAEARRGRVAVHNAAAMMRLLLDLDVPVGAPARAARAHLLLQASDELTRMRSYLRRADHDPPESRGASGTLAAVVADVAQEFADLDIVAQTDLARAVTFDPGTRADLAAALRSLLLNVRQHAQASHVVLHAEELKPSGGWQLTVHDNGDGFEVAHVAWGTGLADVVVGQLEQHRIEVVVESLPGVGTTVTLTNAAAADTVGCGARFA